MIAAATGDVPYVARLTGSRGWQHVLALCCVLAGSFVAARPACASMVEIDKGTYHDAVYLMGNNLVQTDFSSSVSGKVTVNLTDIAWTDVLQSISTTASQLGKIIFVRQGTGTFSFDLQKDETLSLGIYAIAKTGKIGSYTLDCYFTPGASQVPLPNGIWLMLPGLALLSVLARRAPINSVPA